MYLAVNGFAHTINFLLTARHDFSAARRCFERAIDLYDVPEKITIDKSGANTAAAHSLINDIGIDITLRQSKYLNNPIEQDHKAIKRRVRAMMGFKNFRSAISAFAKDAKKYSQVSLAVLCKHLIVSHKLEINPTTIRRFRHCREGNKKPAEPEHVRVLSLFSTR